ncbi:MAG: histidinol-phosphate aminotransferase family protein [Chloroflexota bacterium]|nr:histidinol-phosphate aminotransferase family protein [Chloroflexota bacterium]
MTDRDRAMDRDAASGHPAANGRIASAWEPRTDSGLPIPRLPPLAPVPHGGPDYAELAALGIRPESLLDFSVNGNPLGPSPRALRALELVDPARYPDTDALRLRAGLAAEHDVDPGAVLAGNGSVELIWLLADAYLAPGDRALVVGPTFGEYAAAARRRGAVVVDVAGLAEHGFRASLDIIRGQLAAVRPRLVFICNPNNPTGHLRPLGELAAILDACGEALVVVDEAYLDFADGADSALGLRLDPRAVVLRSLTKNFGLAGLRLGYLVAHPDVVDALASARPPWTVNAFAQAAGLAALDDREHLDAGRRIAREAKAFLVDGLTRLGLACLPSRTNYWLIDVGDAARLRRDLLRRGILVRDCTSFGLPGHVRIAARPLDECERLLEVVGGLVSSGAVDGAR